MCRMLATEAAKLAEFKLTRGCLLVFCCGVISLLALCATKRNDVSHVSASFLFYPPKLAIISPADILKVLIIR